MAAVLQLRESPVQASVFLPAHRPVMRPVGASATTSVVYRRRRVAAAVAVSVLLALGHAALAAVTAGPDDPGSDGRPGRVVEVVRPGDTMWSLAARLQPHGDLRPTVDGLVAAHGSRPLQPGERIAIAPAR